MKKPISWIITLYAVIVLFLLLLDVSIVYWKIIDIPVENLRNIFDITLKQSLANFASSIQRIFISITLIVIFFTLRTVDKRRAFMWFITGVFFIYMALNEGIGFHKIIHDTVKEIIYSSNQSSILVKLLLMFPSYYWQLVLGPFFLVMGLFILFFLLKELKGSHLKRYVYLAFLCFIIAETLSFLEGTYIPVSIIHDKFGFYSDTIVHFMRITEETLELSATTFFWYVFLTYLSHILDGKEITFIKE
jgi:hypothetical protein